MNLAMVKHPRCAKNYWFQVPDELNGIVRASYAVICDTRLGAQPGVVSFTASFDINDERFRAVLEECGATFPLRKITAVYTTLPINKIVVPNRIRRTTPKAKKLSARFLEWNQFGCFKTAVVIGKDFVLSDGYSAYVVAKAIGHRVLAVRMEVGRK